MEAYRKYLAENVLSEEKVVSPRPHILLIHILTDTRQVTYRLLSRALHVHPNTAKQ